MLKFDWAYVKMKSGEDKMKINTQNTKKTKIIIISIIAIVLVSGGIFWWVNSNKNNNEKKEEKTTKIEEKHEDSKKDELIKTEEQKTSEKKLNDLKTKSLNTDHAEGTVEASGYTKFPTYTTVQVEDGTVRVAGQISGLLYDEGGSCSYTLTHTDGTKIELSTEILESPGNKYCKAITKKIIDSEFKSGKWTAITTYKNSKQKQEGRSDAQSFTIEK